MQKNANGPEGQDQEHEKKEFVEPQIVKADCDLESITAHLGGFMSGPPAGGGGFGYRKTKGLRG